MNEILTKNKDVWNDMFDWINSRGGARKYPNETVVTWLLGYARTEHPEKRVLDVGCGWSQSMPMCINEGYEYYGVDVTDRAFISDEIIKNNSWQDKVNLSVFTPPKLDFEDEYFSHAFSTEALHLNADSDSMQKIIDEIYRVLKPGGRFMATVMTPEYWYMPLGTAKYVTDEVIEVQENHVEKNRIGARYFVFQNEDHIKKYFSKFSKVHIGTEHRVFGEFAEKHISHWIISVEK